MCLSALSHPAQFPDSLAGQEPLFAAVSVLLDI